MKEKCLNFWAKHPVLHCVVTYPILIVFFLVLGVIRLIADAYHEAVASAKDTYGELTNALNQINRQSEKNRKSLKEKLQSRIQKA